MGQDVLVAHAYPSYTKSIVYAASQPKKLHLRGAKELQIGLVILHVIFP
jgi:hypothetical protein